MGLPVHPVSLTYGTYGMLLVEAGEPSLRMQLKDVQLNEEELIVELDTLQERWEAMIVQAKACKQRIEKRYNTKVKAMSFQEGDLIWRKTSEARPTTAHRKLAAN